MVTPAVEGKGEALGREGIELRKGGGRSELEHSGRRGRKGNLKQGKQQMSVASRMPVSWVQKRLRGCDTALAGASQILRRFCGLCSISWAGDSPALSPSRSQ